MCFSSLTRDIFLNLNFQSCKAIAIFSFISCTPPPHISPKHQLLYDGQFTLKYTLKHTDLQNLFKCSFSGKTSTDHIQVQLVSSSRMLTFVIFTWVHYYKYQISHKNIKKPD